ncbi:MAG: hydrogenase nickel incorporation protein HypB [Thermoplasmata archaeon]|nr:hydrogenase nickel incorporation protein HypB [Thermoplasmata archaeon]
MHEIHLEIGRDLIKENIKLARENSRILKEFGVKSFDFMGAIGSGKTTIIERFIESSNKRVGVITGDVAGNEDFKRIRRLTPHVVNINTGKECHLDAHMVMHALEKIDLEKIDYLFIENVGNLVCPADFPLGTDKRVCIVSVTEGDDMVRKHPLIFQQADAVVVNKIDLSKLVGVDIEKIKEDVHRICPNTALFLTDARSGKGLDDFFKWLEG